MSFCTGSSGKRCLGLLPTLWSGDGSDSARPEGLAAVSYLTVNGVRYHLEIHGDGPPLVPPGGGAVGSVLTTP